jgi:endonuclease/exonuclease/phosphatase family metal-dependent hydrolase
VRSRKDPQQVLFFFNTHMDPISPVVRNKSVHLLRERITAIAGDAPVLVTGDFNMDAGGRIYQTMLAGDGGNGGLRLIDCYRVMYPKQSGNEGTYIWGPTWLGSIRLNRRLDWILCTPHFQTLECDTDASRIHGRNASDHLPVKAVLYLAPSVGT